MLWVGGAAPPAASRCSARKLAARSFPRRPSGKSVGEVCRELDLAETAVRRWVVQAEIDGGRRDGLTTTEREELSRLRHENRVLREERDILKKAAAFFAKETTR